MIITDVEIENYKSFRTRQSATFGPGFNVIIGPNNAGKSSVLGALTLQVSHQPHMSTAVEIPGQPSNFRLRVKITRQDVLVRLRNRGQQFLRFGWHGGRSPDEAITRWNNWFDTDGSLALVKHEPGSLNVEIDSHLSGTAWGTQGVVGSMTIDAQNNRLVLSEPRGYSTETLAVEQFAPEIATSSTYAFRAERLNISRSPIGVRTDLSPDGSNLPEVLHNLQMGNPARFERYMGFVQRVLPDVKWLTAPNPDHVHFEIRVWNEPRETERGDLTVLLQDCGTGVSQVLAILYVVVTNQEPRVIVIDEPQSFLNPGALRKLLDILREHPQHQYILATHSPMLVTSLELSSLILVRREGAESRLENLDPSGPRAVRQVLNEVGAQISDVYGADSVLWVEGETEEACFPVIAKRFDIPLRGTVIEAVQHTGDFEAKSKKKVEMVFELYATLNLSKAILPPALGFVFDRERRTATEIEDLKRKGEQRRTPVRFLRRTLYENYLLDPEAIAHALNALDPERPAPIAPADIEAWIGRRRWEAKYFEQLPTAQEQASDPAQGYAVWHRLVHGAKLLKDAFSDLTETRVSYTKTRDSVTLTAWLLEHRPEALSEIRAMLETFLNPA